MFKLLGDLKTYLKWQEIITDSLIFRMHNHFTTVLLFTCSIIITATQYVGNPISCIVQGLPTQPINTYCWITSTFTMPDAFNRQTGLEVAHPGVANDFGDVNARKYYTYYQWVCFVLFFQAILCYVPQWLWNAWEGGLINALVMGMNHSLDHKDNVSKKKSILMDYLMTHIRSHNTYVYRYFACEALCLLNIFGQLYLMNKFFDGEFLSYGLRVLQFSDAPQEERVDPMVYVFPRVTKCIFHKYGASGTIQKHDSLCILPLNIVNEKTYIFVWFWFTILSILLLGLMAYRAAIIFAPAVRPRLLHISSRLLPIETCQSISRKIDLGDWWILYVLSSNMDSLLYRDFLQELTKKMGDRNSQPVSRVRNDGLVFRLHALTTMLMLAFSVIISSKQTVGNPIECVHSRDIPVEAFNTYCWIHSTYIVTGAMLGVAGSNVAFPGVASSFRSPENFRQQQGDHQRAGDQEPMKSARIKYYQWVAFVLIFQAILFYTPRWLWKGWEGGKIHALMMDLDIGLCSEVEKKQKKKMLLDYLWENLRFHNWWAYRYYLCEVLALLNVIGQMFLMNRFFDGAFLTFGIDVLRFLESDQEDRVDPMIYVFPRMTKCTFYKYGVSGEVERHDAVCILPLNVVNEKIYVFLWFWFLFLGVLSFITVLYRIVIIFSPRTRVYLLRLRFRLVRKEAVETIVRRSKVGDWFLLYMLGENLDTVIYRDVMHELANKLASRHHHSVPGVKGELQEA